MLNIDRKTFILFFPSVFIKLINHFHILIKMLENPQ